MIFMILLEVCYGRLGKPIDRKFRVTAELQIFPGDRGEEEMERLLRAMQRAGFELLQ